MYAQIVSLGAKPFEVLLCAEHGVDCFVILSVVLVVAVRLEYWVKIDCGYVEAAKVRQFGNYAFEIAAEKVAVEHHTVLVAKIGLLAPIAHNFVLVGDDFAACAKTIDKNLIHYALVEPGRRLVNLFVDGQLIRSYVVVKQRRTAIFAHADKVLVGYAVHDEVVTVQTLLEG